MPRKRRPRRLVHADVRKAAHKDGTYERLLAEQGGVCWICGSPPPANRRLDVDHHHGSLKIRGLLCRRDNLQLRNWMTPEWLDRAALYLRRHADDK